MTKTITTVLASIALIVGLGAGAASADDARSKLARFAPKCATPYELSRVDLGDSPREVRRKLTAKTHRWSGDRHVMVPRLCRYGVTDGQARALIRFEHRQVVDSWVFGGIDGSAFSDVQSL